MDRRHPKFPKTLKIGPYIYEVQLKDGALKKKVDHEEVSELCGDINFIKHRIRIANLPPSRTLVVLLHEVLHGICETTQTDLQEHEVEVLSVGLAEFLKDNNFLADWFYEVLETQAQEAETPQEWTFRPNPSGRTLNGRVEVEFHDAVPQTASPAMRRLLRKQEDQ